MKPIIPLAFFLLAISVASAEENPYCLLPTCPNGSHTLCRFKNPGAVGSCGNVIGRELTAFEIEDLTKLHNNVRQYWDRQENNSESQSSTTEFVPLEWDEELAKSAQRWADQCSKVTDECRNDHRFYVQQRVGVFEIPKFLKAEPQMYMAVGNWHQREISEIRDSQKLGTLLNVFRSEENASDKKKKHYRKAWGNATRFGCGAVRTEDDTKKYLNIACNYGPK